MDQEVKIYEFNPTIYPYMLWIIVSEMPDIISETFNGYNGEPIENLAASSSNLEAFVMPVVRKENPKFGVTMFFRAKECMSYELVAHESSHAAKYLFEHIGADVREHEPFEFLVGWIADCCEKVKENKASEADSSL